ncbi:hypothetical protein HK102_001408, partial [Quaeritorhiza haematococci]
MSNLTSLNMMGCYRIKTYPFAVSDAVGKRGTLPLKELMLGEDSRIQTRGFWLLWCCWNWSMPCLVRLCPFLENLRLNMVLFDLPPNGLSTLLNGCTSLKYLSLVVDRAAVPALCSCSERLRKLSSLELTCHIGLTGEQITSLLDADCLPRLTTLKFHSKHTTVFTNESLKRLMECAPQLEYLELNADDLSDDGLMPVANKLGGHLQSLLVHHGSISNKTLDALAVRLRSVRELTLTDLVQLDHANRLSRLVIGGRNASSSPPASEPVKPKPPLLKRISSVSTFSRSQTDLSQLTPVKNPVDLTGTRLSDTMCHRLRKLELSSVRGFSDQDIAVIPTRCPNLQWVDLSFPFTYPRTVVAIALHCPGILYLRLAKTAIPCVPGFRAAQVFSESGADNTASGNGTGAAARSSPDRSTTRRRSTGGSSSSPTLSFGAPTSSARRTSLKPTSPTSASSSTTSSTSLPPKSQKRRHKNFKTPPKFSFSSPSTLPCAERNHHNRCVCTFLASSPECQAWAFFANANIRRLRLLDVSGNIGVTDWILQEFAQGLPALHTLFVDSCDAVTARGLVMFAEGSWKRLKRLNLRNCRNARFGIVDENFLTRGLEVEVVHGFARGVGTEPGDLAMTKTKDGKPTGHAWNAVKVDGEWRFIDATWGAGNVDGRNFKRSFTPYYFLTPPNRFITSHFPADPAQQHLVPRLSEAEFMSLPFTKPGYHNMGMKLIRPRAGTTASKGNAGTKPLHIVEVNDSWIEIDLQVFNPEAHLSASMQFPCTVTDQGKVRKDGKPVKVLGQMFVDESGNRTFKVRGLCPSKGVGVLTIFAMTKQE